MNICQNRQSYLHYCGYGGSQHHTSQFYLPNPALFSPSHPTSKHFDPYHESNKWRFGWLSHVIQGYQTGILHHRSAREKVTTMHLTRSSWCCICSARSTHCSSYETGLHSLHRQPKQCHWIVNLVAQAVDVHEGRLSRSKYLKKEMLSPSVETDHQPVCHI